MPRNPYVVDEEQDPFCLGLKPTQPEPIRLDSTQPDPTRLDPTQPNPTRNYQTRPNSAPRTPHASAKLINVLPPFQFMQQAKYFQYNEYRKRKSKKTFL